MDIDYKRILEEMVAELANMYEYVDPELGGSDLLNVIRASSPTTPPQT